MICMNPDPGRTFVQLLFWCILHFYLQFLKRVSCDSWYLPSRRLNGSQLLYIDSPQAHPHDYCLLVTIWTFPWIWPFQQLLLYLPQHLSCKSLSVCGAHCPCVLWDRVNTQTPVQMARSGWSPPDTGIGVSYCRWRLCRTLSSELWSPALSEKVQTFYYSKLLIRQGLARFVPF